MKYIYSFILLLILFACKPKQESERIISVTIEPQRYFAEKIAGDKFTLHTVVPAGQSPETYDPTPQQMVEIGKSQAYFQIGPIGFEMAWMESIRQNNPNVKFFDLSEGMSFIQSEEHHHEHHQEGEVCEHDHHHGPQDPHIWSSFHGARIIARNTLNAFVSLDEANKEFYTQNYGKLVAEIEETEQQVVQMLKPVLSRAFIIYHPALTYFAREFNLLQLCIEMDGKEPSPAQLKDLVETARLHNARVVFIQQEFDQKNAEIIARETGCDLVTINPLAYDWKKEMIHITKALANE